MGDLGLELVKAGLAQADGDVADHACHGAADAVVAVTVFLNGFGHAGGGFVVGAAGGCERVHGLTIDRFKEFEEFRVGGCGGVFRSRGDEVFVANRRDERNNLDVVRETQVLFGNGTSSDTAWYYLSILSFFLKNKPQSRCAKLTNGLTGTAATTTTASLDTVFLEIGQIGMARPGEQVHCAATIVLGSLVLIANHHADRSSQGDSKLRP